MTAKILIDKSEYDKLVASQERKTVVVLEKVISGLKADLCKANSLKIDRFIDESTKYYSKQVLIKENAGLRDALTIAQNRITNLEHNEFYCSRYRPTFTQRIEPKFPLGWVLTTMILTSLGTAMAFTY